MWGRGGCLKICVVFVFYGLVSLKTRLVTRMKKKYINIILKLIKEFGRHTLHSNNRL